MRPDIAKAGQESIGGVSRATNISRLPEIRRGPFSPETPLPESTAKHTEYRRDFRPAEIVKFRDARLNPPGALVGDSAARVSSTRGIFAAADAPRGRPRGAP